jgi:hypothetical protein
LLLYWELQAFGLVFVTTIVVLALLLIGTPAVLLFVRRGRAGRRHVVFDRATASRRSSRTAAIAAILFAAAGGLAYWRTTRLPGADSEARRVSLDDIAAGAAVQEQRCVIYGVLQRKYEIRYVEELSGRMVNSSFRRGFAPITRKAWTPAEPVRFLADVSDGGIGTDSGILLRGHIPSYVRRALEQRGLQIASDAMVFSRDPDFGRVAWYVAVAFAGIGVFASLVFACAWLWISLRSEKQMSQLRSRAPAYLLMGISLVPIGFGLLVGAQKVVHITTAEKADGVITYTRISHHSFVKYSFYVDYRTASGRFHQYAFTDTPFSKAVGDKVTVLYQSEDPRQVEILAFDTEWMISALLLTLGAAGMLAAAILLRRSKRVTA